MSSKHIIVIGGGVIGLSTAYNLARRGRRVVLLEKDTVGEGSSGRAAGIATALLWTETGVRARELSLELFRELSRTLEGFHFHDEHGCLNLFDAAHWPARQELLPLYDRLKRPYEVLAAEEMRRRWPEMHPATDHIGLFDPIGGYGEPPQYLRGLAAATRALGVEIREQQKVVGFIRDGSRVIGVRTASETLSADAVVSTVHVWTLPFLDSVGVRLPVKHFVHQRYLSAPTVQPRRFPAVNANPYGGYVRPALGGRFLLGVESSERDEWRVTSTDFHMRTLDTAPELRARTVESFLPLFPGLKGIGWESEHVGLISFSMDGEPLLGPIAAVPGLFVGLAFHSGGFGYNPVAGRLLAEFVCDGKTSIDVSAFAPDRNSPVAVAKFLEQTFQQKQAEKRRH